MKILRLVLIIFCILLLSSCIPTPEEKLEKVLIGKWQKIYLSEGLEKKYEFFRRGAFIEVYKFKDTGSVDVYYGDWKVIASDKIKIVCYDREKPLETITKIYIITVIDNESIQSERYIAKFFPPESFKKEELKRLY